MHLFYFQIREDKEGDTIFTYHGPDLYIPKIPTLLSGTERVRPYHEKYLVDEQRILVRGRPKIQSSGLVF